MSNPIDKYVKEFIEETTDEYRDYVMDVPHGINGELDKIVVYDALHNYIDIKVTYYSDAMRIIEEFNYYTGWDELINKYLGGKCENVCQFAYAILLNGFEKIGIVETFNREFVKSINF